MHASNSPQGTSNKHAKPSSKCEKNFRKPSPHANKPSSSWTPWNWRKHERKLAHTDSLLRTQSVGNADMLDEACKKVEFYGRKLKHDIEQYRNGK